MRTGPSQPALPHAEVRARRADVDLLFEKPMRSLCEAFSLSKSFRKQAGNLTLLTSFAHAEGSNVTYPPVQRPLL